MYFWNLFVIELPIKRSVIKFQSTYSYLFHNYKAYMEKSKKNILFFALKLKSVE